MGMKALGFIGMGLLLAMTAQAAPSGLLNDTGQTQCLNVFGNALEECTPENSGDDSPYPGQDGRYGRDAAAKYPEKSGFTKPEGSGGHGGFAFTPLDVNGNPIPLVGDPPVPAETPRCIWDRVTNLIWEVKTTSGLQNSSSSYGWGSNNTGNCTGGSGCSSNAYTTDINAVNLCGETANNWRLPTRRELLSIVDFDRNNPSIDTAFFPNTQSGFNQFYWSADVLATVPDGAWAVGFGDGFTYAGGQADQGVRVRLVRSGQ